VDEIDSSAAFDLKSLNQFSPPVSQGLQIGGTTCALWESVAKLQSRDGAPQPPVPI